MWKIGNEEIPTFVAVNRCGVRPRWALSDKSDRLSNRLGSRAIIIDPVDKSEGDVILYISNTRHCKMAKQSLIPEHGTMSLVVNSNKGEESR